MSSIFFESENMDFGAFEHTNIFSSEQNSSFPFLQTSFESSILALIGSMKPTFLPREENNSVLRQVFLSEGLDSFFLLKKEKTTLLIGSGFDSCEIAGKKYMTFPDFRLPFSEKNNIHGWILLDENIPFEIIIRIASILNFPPIFTTKNLIAKIRNNDFFSSNNRNFRFIEMFSNGSFQRQIGSISLLNAKIGNKNFLGFQSENSVYAYDFLPLENNITSPVAHFEIHQKKVKNIDFAPGEILHFLGENISKNPFKFTFDTFFIDGRSVGIIDWFLLSDRQELAENGVLIFSFDENIHLRTISGHIFIDSRWFVHQHEVLKIHKEIIKAIRILYEQNVSKNPKISRSELAQVLKKELAKYIFIMTGKIPLIMPIINEKH